MLLVMLCVAMVCVENSSREKGHAHQIDADVSAGEGQMAKYVTACCGVALHCVMLLGAKQCQ